MNASEICAKAGELVGGDRAATHGDKVANHENIARLWVAYLAHRIIPRNSAAGYPCSPLDALDVANMMELLKIARRMAGAHNIDDYVDGAGYAACAGEIAARMAK